MLLQVLERGGSAPGVTADLCESWEEWLGPGSFYSDLYEQDE